MKTREKSFFDEENRLSELSRKRDFLEELNSRINCERSRKPVERVMRETKPKGPASYRRTHWQQVRRDLLDGTYEPAPVKRRPSRSPALAYALPTRLFAAMCLPLLHVNV